MRLAKWTPCPYKVVLTPDDAGYDTAKSGEIQQKEVQSPFEGEIEYQALSYSERLKLMKDNNFTGKEGAGFDNIIALVGIAKKYIKTVNLTVKEDGEKVTSVDDLEYTQEGSAVIEQVATRILRGAKLGKS